MFNYVCRVPSDVLTPTSLAADLVARNESQRSQVRGLLARFLWDKICAPGDDWSVGPRRRQSSRLRDSSRHTVFTFGQTHLKI